MICVENGGRVYSITQLCQEFDVTARTIRHYESCGLVEPARQGQRRVFSERDRVRLRLVLRGRSLGFNLSEIAEMIDLYDLDPSEVAQLERTLAYGRQKISQLESKRAAISEAIEELRAWERKLGVQLQRRLRQQSEEGKR
ncbi:MAG: MerR family DNA-binding transcriptional regulator [Thermaerobacter sp.]|nr:MerR family DNA-binding transcriptional regulator [Thermaerobacter sp.]